MLATSVEALLAKLFNELPLETIRAERLPTVTGVIRVHYILLLFPYQSLLLRTAKRDGGQSGCACGFAAASGPKPCERSPSRRDRHHAVPFGSILVGRATSRKVCFIYMYPGLGRRLLLVYGTVRYCSDKGVGSDVCLSIYS